MAQYTITHSENVKGWSSFWSYVPDWFARLGNRFYTIKNGQLWQHHDTDNPVRNNFYNSQGSSIVKTVFNEFMSEDKAFRTMVLESDQKWDALVTTNYTESSITAEEFNTRESRQFSFIRRNEDSTDFHGNGQGIGVIQAIDDLEITFSQVSEFVNINDQLWQLNGSTPELIGTIEAIADGVITVNAITTVPVVGYYALAQKNARAEGGDVRGFYMEVTLSNDDTTEGELFAVGSEISKSYV